MTKIGAEVNDIMNECMKAQIKAANKIGYLQGYCDALKRVNEAWKLLMEVIELTEQASEEYCSEDKDTSEKKPLQNDSDSDKGETKEPIRSVHDGFTNVKEVMAKEPGDE